MSTVPPINLQYLSQISDGDLDFELELLNLFVEDAKLHLDAAEAAVNARDCTALGREAHHLKGSSGNVGAQAMQTVAYALEQQSLKNSFDGVAEKIQEMKSFLIEVEAFVSTHG